MKTILFLLASLASINLFCQIELKDRLEYSEDENYFNFSVFSLENQRLLVKSKKELARKTYEYRYQLYDKQLKKLNESKMTFQKGFTDFSTYLNEEAYYVLRNNNKGQVRLHKLDLKGLTASYKDYVFPKKTSFSDLIVFGDYAYFKVKIRREESFIRKLNLKTQKHTDIRIEKFQTFDIDFFYYEVIGKGENKELLFVRTHYNEDYKRHFLVQRFNKSGGQIGPIMKLHFNEYYVQNLSFKLSKSKNKFLITGGFSSDNDYTPNGIFNAKVKLDGKTIFANYIQYSDVENFFSYLPERKEKKLEKKKAKAESKGKELNLEYNVVSHEIYENDGKYYYVGEFYYPTYRQECTTTVDANGMSRTRCRQVFDGYQYTHAVIHCFDETGKKLWGNTFEMWKFYKPYSRQAFIKLNFESSDVVELLFIDYSWLKSISFKNGQALGVGKKYTYASEMEDESDEVKATSHGTMSFWYDNIMYVYGWQKVKNHDEKIGHKKRKVYYINILEYK